MEKMLLFFVYSVSIINATVEIWRLEEIKINQLKCIKKAPMHTVFKGEDFYLKILIANTRPFKNGRDQVFLKAVFSGILDGVAPLRAVVVNHRGQCYGYATEVCYPVKININEIKKNGWKVNNKDAFMVVKLFSKMREITLNQGFCFNDLSPTNLGIRDGECYYFDLDGFWQLDAYKKNNKNWKRDLFYLDKKINSIE